MGTSRSVGTSATGRAVDRADQGIWSANREVYGRPRIHAELQADGERIGAKRVGRLMRHAGIVGVSRRVVGWSMAAHLRTELVLDALNMAIWQRRPHGVVHHSDQVSQYTSIAFGARCKEAGVRPRQP